MSDPSPTLNTSSEPATSIEAGIYLRVLDVEHFGVVGIVRIGEEEAYLCVNQTGSAFFENARELTTKIRTGTCLLVEAVNIREFGTIPIVAIQEKLKRFEV